MVSEYQYYEFQAIDRSLTAEEQRAVASLSSRVNPHPRRAVFTYHWSGFPGDAEQVLARYYDAMLYVASWNHTRLIFRFPRAAADLKGMQAYIHPPIADEYISLSAQGEHVVLGLNFYGEEGVYRLIDGEGWLDAMLPLRDDLLRGDYRALYLAWLKVLQVDDLLDSVLEPPVPMGLHTLTPALRKFVEFFEIEEGLVAAAALASESASPESETLQQAMTRAAIVMLPRDECDGWLLRLAQGELHLGLALKARLRELVPELDAPAVGAPRRTVGWLVGEAERQRERARRRRAAEAKRRRIQELEALAQREAQTWQEIEALIERRVGHSYRDAVELLVKLRELAEHQGRTEAFQTRVSQIRAGCKPTSALLRRLKEAGL
jgi:hypothetical protein